GSRFSARCRGPGWAATPWAPVPPCAAALMDARARPMPEGGGAPQFILGGVVLRFADRTLAKALVGPPSAFREGFSPGGWSPLRRVAAEQSFEKISYNMLS